MADAVNMRVIDRNPVDPVKPPKRTKVKKGINALDTEGRARVLASLEDMELTPVTVAARVALYTGLREGEICALQWRDVDLEARTLWVRRAIGEGVGGCYEKDTKTDRARDVALPEALTSLLGDWRRAQRVAFAEAGGDARRLLLRTRRCRGIHEPEDARARLGDACKGPWRQGHRGARPHVP